MLKTINVKVNADSSITARYPYKIYQGEINKNKFVIDASNLLSDLDGVYGYIGFKRSDNQKSGFVPLTKEDDGTFTYVIKDYWTLNIPSKVWFTIKFCKNIQGTDESELQLYVGNSSFNVDPLADYILGDDVPPDAVTELQERIDEKLNKDFTTYEKLDWEDVDNDDLVILNKVEDGVVTPYYAEAKDLYTTVNDIKADEDGNISITGSDIPVSETNDDSIEDELHKKVNFTTNENINFPSVTVYSAEYAEKDGDGNTITSKYVNVDSTQSITAVKKLVRNGAYNQFKPTPNLKLQNTNLENDEELSLYTDHNNDLYMYSSATDVVYENNLDAKTLGYIDYTDENNPELCAIQVEDDKVNRVVVGSNGLEYIKLWDKSDFDIWIGTLLQYNALPTKDNKTFYIVLEDEEQEEEV